MTRRTFLAGSLFAAAGKSQPERQPNIVVILADDLGYGDVGCYNAESKIPTQHLDRLAARGIRFTHAHSPSAVCTPTRYGLLTGRYSWRTRLIEGVLDGFDPPLIEKGRITMASLLKQHGYRTGCVGKWHLGMNWTTKDGSPVPQRTTPGFRPGYEIDYERRLTGGPLDYGFDFYYGISASLDMSPHCFIENDRTVGIPDIRNPEERSLFISQAPAVKTKDFRQDQVMPVCVKKATQFIEQSAKKPFFLYMPLSAPHLPVVPSAGFEGRSKAGTYGDFVVEVDEAVGDVVSALERSGVLNDTLIIFTSDNGGLWHWWEPVEKDDVAGGRITQRGQYVKDFGHAGNARWRGTKADIWEGGHRVPFIASWPRRAKSGVVCDHLVCLIDLLSTTADVLKVALPDDAAEDSFSLLPVLLDPRRTEPVRRSVVIHSLRGVFAMREGDWKYVPVRGSGGFSAPVKVEPKAGEPVGQLYNLRTDPNETKNVHDEHPEIVRRLAALLQQAQMGSRTRPR